MHAIGVYYVLCTLLTIIVPLIIGDIIFGIPHNSCYHPMYTYPDYTQVAEVVRGHGPS